MATDFSVNKHDLEYILRQIKIAEAHAGGMTLRAAVQAEYGVSATDAALLPAGLRTVDGRDTNLLVNRDYGASDTLFPRLLDPVYTNENDEAGFPLGPSGPTVTNTNYGQAGNVVDSDPRVISNLIVDQTPANRAAVLAALKVEGIEGTQATAAADAIQTAYNGTLIANGNNASVNRAQATFNAASSQQAAAAAVDVAAVQKVAAYTAADALTDAAVTSANAANAAAASFAAGFADPLADGDSLTALHVAATAAAAAALADAQAVMTALGSNNAPNAQAAAAAIEALVAQLAAMAVDGIDPSDAAAAQTASDAYSAQAAADSRTNIRTVRLPDAESEATAARAALDDATDDLNVANAALLAAQAAANTSGTPAQAAANLAAILDTYGLETGAEGGLLIRNLSPDIGLSPSFSTFMTIFGQFFDHGLDLVTKGNNGTVYIPLQNDDPLIAGADKVFGTADDLPAHLRFMTLTRAEPTMVNGTAQHTNLTTSLVDQNQTYTSHASHQVFLREYVRVNGQTLSTGHLLDGSTASGSKAGAIANWGEVKAQALEMLGIRLTDLDVDRVPLLRTDQYGNLQLGPNGYAQMVMAPDAEHAQAWFKEGTAAGITTAGSVASGFQFLLDIAHNAVPGTVYTDANGVTQTVAPDQNDGGAAGNAIATDARGRKVAYDDELLDSHFVTGDGRGNENIALMGVHSVFHSEHNRLVEAYKTTILATGDRAFINEWLRVDLGPSQPIPSNPGTLQWDGARLFQAARFVNEMQYQHGVFEEFARAVQPNVNAFVFTNNAEIDPSILAEFAHTVYRFGHSMLNDTVDRLDNNLGVVGGEQLSLIDAFLDPQAYLSGGANLGAIQGALFRGMSRDVGNEIDEFVVPALRSNLLGLPLDLAAINIARGRETGIPSLQEARAQLYNDFGLADLKPYTSWLNFTQNIKNPLSVVNFIAAYGTHQSILDADTLEEKRAAATLLLLGGDGAPADRLDFLNGRGAYNAVNGRGGLDDVDFWIGGLAEAKNEFGGMLGSTFNFIFEYQMERLQDGDRLYYLSRTQGLNLLNVLEQNTFADMVMRNSDLGDLHATHLNAHIMVTPDLILELDRGIAQEDYNPDDNGAGRAAHDPVWDDPILQQIDPKVRRDYSESTQSGGHDYGGELHFRGGEHVVLGGTEGNDTLTSDRGIDTLWGDGGDDYLNAGTESDEVFGGDGNDIIEDPFGDNFLRGNRGHDVISVARGLNIILGGQGQDAVFLGQDPSEVFGGEDDDFILGGSGGDFIMGNEGHDWIEGGDGFDVLSGDNTELFFNSTIIGHDVLWSQGNDTDYDMESGDDIALTGPGVQRFEGMFGFDWASTKYDTGITEIDLGRPLLPTIPAEILRDRFDHVEGASGWVKDDVLIGDDRGHVDGEIAAGAEPEALFADDLLLDANLDLIAGLRTWITNARTTLFGTEAIAFQDGNILLGGGGSDTLHGQGGYDLIDGDVWLNVRIGITVGGRQYTAESLSSDKVVAGPNAGKVFEVVNGVVASEAAFGGRSLQSLLLDRTIRPDQMRIIRELLTDDSGTDVAVFFGPQSDYVIEGRNATRAAFDVNGDGWISVRDLNTGTRRDGANRLAVDDTDLLKNIEVLRFADGDIVIAGGPDPDPVVTTTTAMLLTPVVPTAANGVPGAGGTVGTLSFTGPGTFAAGAGTSAGLALSAAGVVTATTAFGNNQTRTLNAEVTTADGIFTETIVVRTGGAGANVFEGTNLDDVTYGRGGADVLRGLGGDDFLLGQAGFDTLDGGAGNDVLHGGPGGDVFIGGAGADTIYTGAGNDNVRDAIRYTAASEFGDRVFNFDANGNANVVDQVQFGGALNTALDDGLDDDNFRFVTGNNGAGKVAVTVGQGDNDAEALLLSGTIAAEGVTNANLGVANAVATRFNAEFTITAANGEDALLVVNDHNGNGFSVWVWTQANGGQVAANEIELVGIFSGNATVGINSFDFI